MYGDNIFADRFRYQLTMIQVHITIGLSRLLDDYIVHVIVISKITTVNLQDVGTTPMQDCSETIVYTALVETWMSLENVKNLGTAEKLDIYIQPL